MDQDLFEKGLAKRKATLGGEYVDKAFENAGDFNLPFQEAMTAWCWGFGWGDETIDAKTRSMMNLAMIGALGKMHEWETHCRGALNNGVSKEEIRAIVTDLNDTDRLDAEGREIRIFPLRVARAEDLAQTIDQMYPEPPMPYDNRGRPLPHLQGKKEVSVRADPVTNSLIVDAPAQRLSGFAEYRALDVWPDVRLFVDGTSHGVHPAARLQQLPWYQPAAGDVMPRLRRLRTSSRRARLPPGRREMRHRTGMLHRKVRGLVLGQLQGRLRLRG